MTIMHTKTVTQRQQPLPPILLQRPIRMAVAPRTSPTTIIMTMMTTMTMHTLPESDVSTAPLPTAGATMIRTIPTCTGMTAILATGV